MNYIENKENKNNNCNLEQRSSTPPSGGWGADWKASRINQLFQNKKENILSIYFTADFRSWKTLCQPWNIFKKTVLICLKSAFRFLTRWQMVW